MEAELGSPNREFQERELLQQGQEQHQNRVQEEEEPSQHDPEQQKQLDQHQQDKEHQQEQQLEQLEPGDQVCEQGEGNASENNRSQDETGL